MPGRLILVLFLLWRASLLCQLPVSKLYHTPPRSVPLGIFNFEPHHFYVARYNRIAHDITVERRRKSDGSVAAFTALRLDSVNAPWFNYENLDHVFFEKNGTLFFVFNRVLNNKSELYMKRIDTLGKTSGFIQLLSLKTGKNEDFLDLSFSLTEKKEILVARTRAMGTDVYRQIDLIDPESRKFIRSAKLPPESPFTGYSQNYMFGPGGDLYYLLFHHHFEWNISEQGTAGLSFSSLINTSVGVDSVYLVALDAGRSGIKKMPVAANGLTALHVVVPHLSAQEYRIQLMYSGVDAEGKETIRFSEQRFSHSLERLAVTDETLSEEVARRLTFFDGSEDDEASRKNYSLESCFRSGDCNYYFSERVQQNYFKELLVWSTDSTGSHKMQVVIPRKILFFSERSRFKGIGRAMHAANGRSVYTFLLENRDNEMTPVEDFSFHDFRRQESVIGANLVAYVLKDGSCSKKVIFRNGEYSCVPVNYSGTMQDVVLYLVKNDVERFAVISLDEI